MRDIVRAEPRDDGYVVLLAADGRQIGAGLTAAEALAWVATVNARRNETGELGEDPALLAGFALRLKTAALDRSAGGRSRWGIGGDSETAP